jgi:hypothetical protein
MNEALRQHVTRVGFDLTLGKTHIAALVYLDVCIRNRTYMRVDGRPWSHFAGGVNGCIARGLVEHHYAGRPTRRGQIDHMGRHYTITKAGRLVRDLLKEAGIWQEYEAALPVRRELVAAS